MERAKYPQMSILIVDDEKIMLNSYTRVLYYSGISNLITCDDSRKVLDIINSNTIQLILLDLLMPHISGEELLKTISEQFPEIPIIIITGVREVEVAIKCMRSSAFDYLVKPVDEDTLISSVERGIRFKEMQTEISSLKKSIFIDDLTHPEFFEDIKTHCRSMMAIFQYIEAISTTSQPVLISGETGVGKELIAESIHKCSQRPGEFIKISIAGLDDTMFSDTLFGHKKGAFTGADSIREGLVKKATNGTLFLDEIGDLNENSQIKLLRLLQEKEYLPLGSDESLHTNTRIIAATNRDLDKRVEQGLFRKDLYYRLKTHHIQVPALRDRRDDLPVLIDYFLSMAIEEYHLPKLHIRDNLIREYERYDFPGNIRELQSKVFDDVARYKVNHHNEAAVSKGKQNEDALSISYMPASNHDINYFNHLENLPSLKQTTNLLIEEALRRSKGNKSLAAKLLGITRQTIVKHLGQ
jgi:DNA-binding NtrC family response regulator